MDQEQKEILKKTLELAQDNNKILHGLKRSMFWGKIFRTAYWLVIIGAAIGVYYYIEPYIDSAIGAYGNVKGDLQNFSDLFRIKK